MIKEARLDTATKPLENTTTQPATGFNPYNQARFLLSCARLDQLPPDALPEVAFVGRSNAGKSSALNAICAKKGLARVSKTPGRTQLINLFDVPEGRFVDLPGYGFAQVPLAIKKNWGVLIGGYLQKRDNLCGLVIMMDIRHPLTDLDAQMLDWGQQYQRHCHILLTKSDKLSFGAASKVLQEVKNKLSERWPDTTVQVFSAQAKRGLDNARVVISNWLSEGSEHGLPDQPAAGF